MARVGIIGTGEMGRPVVDRLIAGGHEVVAFARRAEVRSDLVDAGATLAESPVAVAGGREIVIIYVYSDAQVGEILLEEGVAMAMEPGSTIVVHTTGSPRTVQSVQSLVAGRGVTVLDAPGSGGPAQVAAGTLTLFVGGDLDRVEDCRPLFECYASRVVHQGPLGSGQTVKLLNNLLFGAHVQLAVEISRLAESLGLRPSELAQTLHGCSGSSYALDLLGQMGSSQDLMDRAGSFIRKDVRLALAVADELGAPVGNLDRVVGPLLGHDYDEALP